MKWRDPHPLAIEAWRRRQRAKRRPRKIYAIEKTIKVSGEPSPEFVKRMERLGVRVLRVDG